MANDLTQPRNQPLATEAEPTQWWPPSLRKLHEQMIGGWRDGAEIPAPISVADQSWISSRLAALEAKCSATDDRQQVAKALATLFGAYPAGSAGGQDASLRARAYLEVLADRPAWAIDAAVKRWLRGEVDVDARARDFPPSAPRLRELATAAMTPLYAEKGRLQLMLRARVVAPVSEADRGNRAVAVMKLLCGDELTTGEQPA